MPQAVLGIDAAWTESRPSGVALAVAGDSKWRLAAVAPSYESFVALADGKTVDWFASHFGGKPNPRNLLDASCSLLAGAAHVTVVAVDMPLARTPITGRRQADRAVSKSFAKKKCSTHSPSATRPGPISDEFRHQFEAAGYQLVTNSESPQDHERSLIEVYPHPALITLLGLDERLKYKVTKMNRYWRDELPEKRRQNLLESFSRLRSGLEGKFIFDDTLMPPLLLNDMGRITALKTFEDALDAAVCAWVGIEFLLGRCRAYGDETAAIWVPVPSK